jgi:hypothetical protein
MLGRPPDGFVAPSGLLAVRRMQALRVSTRYWGAGQSGEFPGGMPEFRRFVRENFPGTPPGVVSRTFAKLHEGSHAACDEAVE